MKRVASVLSRTTTKPVASTESMVRRFGGASGSSDFTLPDLPYDFAALEPVLPARIMELHHQFHHKAYVTNLNAALERRDAALSRGDLSGVIAADNAIKFNGGGHVNHSIFWTNLAPTTCGGGEITASSVLAKAIDAKWGSLAKFQEVFNAQTAAVQGSGWGWLVYDSSDGNLKIQTMPNQDPIVAPLVPLLGIDVWEHAYYLQYENRRPEYLKEIWKVVNWRNVEERYSAAIAK